MPTLSRELYKYPLYLIFHPFNGFWELKYERSRKLNLIISFSVLFLLIVMKIMQTQYSGFVVNIVYPDNINSLMECLYVIVPVLFWSIANWSLTTLMDGEGKFVDIFTSTCFALVPMLLIQLPWIGLSNLISLEEVSFYHFFTSFSVLWCAYLLFVGNMTVQQYSPSKTIGTIILTIAAMAFMAFLCLLFFSLIQQMVAFVQVIHQEIVLRR